MGRSEGSLPDGWSRRPLNEVADIRLSNVDKKTQPDETVVSLCNYMDVYSNATITGQLEFMQATATLSQIERFELRPGDVIITKDSEDPSDIAVSSVVADGIPERLICGYHLAMMRPSEVDGPFLAWAFRSRQLHSYFARRANGSTRFGLTSQVIAQAPIPLPPLPEQRKIAAILGAVDRAIDATRAVIEQTRRVKAGLLQELLTRGVGVSGAPAHCWERLTIAEAGDVQLGQQRHPMFADGDNIRPYLRVANVLDGEIDFSDLNEMHFPVESLEKFELRAGDILLNEGQSLDLVGRSAMYKGEIPGCCVQKTLLRFRCGPKLLPSYAEAVFQHWLWSGKFARVAVQTTSVAHLTAVRFKQMEISVPPRELQETVVEKVAAAEEAHRTARRHQDRLTTLKAGLLQDLLSGAVRVKP